VISVTISIGIDITKQNPRQKNFQISGGDPSHKIFKSKISMLWLGRKTQGDALINIQIKSRETTTPSIVMLKIEKIHPSCFS
jgi:hypothetical protein